ncbi:MAG: hypothetical protein U0796_05620 [Gemmatales bacterium]
MQVTTPRQIETNRLRSKLDMILEKYQDMDLSDDAPFVIYLTERMLGDIEEARRQNDRELRLQELRQRATWPSLN